MSKENRSVKEQIFIDTMSNVFAGIINNLIIAAIVSAIGWYGLNYYKEEILNATSDKIAKEFKENKQVMIKAIDDTIVKSEKKFVKVLNDFSEKANIILKQKLSEEKVKMKSAVSNAFINATKDMNVTEEDKIKVKGFLSKYKKMITIKKDENITEIIIQNKENK